jgi:heptosyltransferase I
MRRLLLVKTSSLGDVVHNLPVVSDLHARYPDLEIDWAVEESFAEIPVLHPAVSNVIPVAPRRWRKSLASRRSWREMLALRRLLQSRAYDAVLDTQGLLKSAVIARMAPGQRFGLDWSSSREPLWPFYDVTFRVRWSLHAVERNRQLAAQALGYTPPSEVDYGIGGVSPSVEVPTQPDGRYAVLLHATSARSKLWPEHQWVKLADHLMQRGLRVVLPWGSEQEQARSERIAGLLKHATVPARLSLSEAAALLRGAQSVFGVDTGLTHLAVALGRPTVGIYCATDPAATGLYGSAATANVGGKDGPPPVATVIAAWHRVRPNAQPANSSA